MGKQVTISVADSLKALKKSLEDVSLRVEAQINNAVKDTVHAAYASIVAKVQSEMRSGRQDYLKGLEITDLGDNSYVISLDGDYANALEEGWGSFDLKKGMLASTKMVGVGSRAGQPWVQQSKPRGKQKESHKYAHVPIDKKPFAIGSTSNMADAILAMTAVGVNQVEQKITNVFKDENGIALEGKVAVGRSADPRLNNLTKYQKNYKGVTQSIYTVYRTVSENGKPWIHPGKKGIFAFDEAEKDIIKNLDLIIKTLL